MFCKTCGAKNADNSVYCDKCGAKMYESSNNYADADNSAGTSGYYSANQFNEGMNPYSKPVTTEQFEMKWFKFVIYVQIFLAAVLSLYNGVTAFFGWHYGSEMETRLVYAYYGNGLMVADKVMGICCVIYVVAILITRWKLAGFKRNAHYMYLGCLVLSLAIDVIYIIVASAITGMLLIEAKTVSQIITNIVVIALNYVYFKKRASLFVND